MTYTDTSLVGKFGYRHFTCMLPHRQSTIGPGATASPYHDLLYLTPFFCDRPPFGTFPLLPRPDRVPTGRPSVQTRHAKHRYGSILRPDHRARPPGCPQSEGAIPARAWSIWPHFCRRSTRMARTPEPLSTEFLTSVHGPMLENHPSWW